MNILSGYKQTLFILEVLIMACRDPVIYRISNFMTEDKDWISVFKLNVIYFPRFIEIIMKPQSFT